MTLDVRSVRAAVSLVRPEIPTSLTEPGAPRTTGLPGVTEDHARRAVASEVVHTYARRGGAVFAVVTVRDNARDQVLVSGPEGEQLWSAVCAALEPALRGNRGPERSHAAGALGEVRR